MKNNTNKKNVLHTIAFVLAVINQVLWLNAIEGWYYVFVMDNVSANWLTELLTDSSFWITIGGFCLSVSLLLIIEKTLRKWELRVLLLLAIIEAAIILYWWYVYFRNSLYRHALFTTYGLQDVIIFSFIASIPLAIHIWILVKHRREWYGKKQHMKGKSI